jgi:hypothetical protein
MNRVAKANSTLRQDLIRVAAIVRNYGTSMGIDSAVCNDFVRRCAAVNRIAADFDATVIGEPHAPVMPPDADSDDEVLSMFDQDEFSTVQESEGMDPTNHRVANRVARKFLRGA